MLDGSRVLGLVTQNILFFHLGHRYGHALWSERPVSEFVETHNEGRIRSSIEMGDHAARAQKAAHEFSERVLALYDPEDRLAGGIESIDRRGRRSRFGFTSVSIGLVAWRGEPGITYRRLVELAAEVKTAAKRTTGPVVLLNQRSLA